jgi:hypothetical protein
MIQFLVADHMGKNGANEGAYFDAKTRITNLIETGEVERKKTSSIRGERYNSLGQDRTVAPDYTEFTSENMGGLPPPLA